jgi:hypothetical protein
VIIFDKFGDWQTERSNAVSVFSDNPMSIVTPVSSLSLLAPTKEGTKERHPAGMSERLSRYVLVAAFDVPTRDRIAVLLRETRVADRGPRTALSNRELDLSERGLSHCKQRKATASNRELSTNHNFAAPSPVVRDRIEVLLRGPRIAAHGSLPLTTLLTETASRSEIDLTHSKQATGTFLTETRIVPLPGFPRAFFAEQFDSQNRTSNRFWPQNRSYRKKTIKPFLTGARTAFSRALGARNSAFLPGTGQYVESGVTHSKQTTAIFLPGARTAISVLQFRAEFRTEAKAQCKKESGSRDVPEQGRIPLHRHKEKELL